MTLPSVIISPEANEANDSGEWLRHRPTIPPAPPSSGSPAVGLPPATGRPSPVGLPPTSGHPVPVGSSWPQLGGLPPTTGGPVPVTTSSAPTTPFPYPPLTAPEPRYSVSTSQSAPLGWTGQPPTPEAAVERFGLRSHGATDVGAQRDVNEDAFYADDALGLYVVCDGMGGHASGQVASNLALRTIINAVKSGDPPPEPGEEPLSAAMKAGNTAVFQRSQMDPACRGMGTTAVGIRAEDDLVHLCHCGDSRAYLLRGGQLIQMTRDHSLINLYEDRPDLVGQLGPATSNVIIRAVGLDSKVEIDHRTVAMEHGDVYMLCCDGLNDLVEDWMIREIMTSGETIEVIAANLIRTANANGGTDNITVIVVQIYDERLCGAAPTGPAR